MEEEPKELKKNFNSIRDGEFNGKVYRDYKIIAPIG